MKKLVAALVEKRDLAKGQIGAVDANGDVIMVDVGADATAIVADSTEDAGIKYVTKNELLDFAVLTELTLDDPARADTDKICIYDDNLGSYKWIDRSEVVGQQLSPVTTLKSNEAAYSFDTAGALTAGDDKYLFEFASNGSQKVALTTNNALVFGNDAFPTIPETLTLSGGAPVESAPSYVSFRATVWDASNGSQVFVSLKSKAGTWTWYGPVFKSR